MPKGRTLETNMAKAWFCNIGAELNQTWVMHEHRCLMGYRADFSSVFPLSGSNPVGANCIQIIWCFVWGICPRLGGSLYRITEHPELEGTHRDLYPLPEDQGSGYITREDISESKHGFSTSGSRIFHGHVWQSLWHHAQGSWEGCGKRLLSQEQPQGQDQHHSMSTVWIQNPAKVPF